MGTACLTTTLTSDIRCQYWWVGGGSSGEKKIEQVFSYGHQMSLAVVGPKIGVSSMSDMGVGGGWGWGLGLGGESHV